MIPASAVLASQSICSTLSCLSQSSLRRVPSASLLSASQTRFGALTLVRMRLANLMLDAYSAPRERAISRASSS